MLAKLLWQKKQTDPAALPQRNFRGFLVGNPSTDRSYDDGEQLIKYYQSHGLPRIDDNDGSHTQNYYDILADFCHLSEILRTVRFPHPIIDSLKRQLKEDIGQEKLKIRFDVPSRPPCIDEHVSAYLNRQDVQTAIHADISYPWIECAGPNYDIGVDSIVPYYKFFHDHTDLQVLVYSGDTDTVINFMSTESWIIDMKLQMSYWNTWHYIDWANPKNTGSQIGGWWMQSENKRFTFRTVKGAGHMVPWYQPAPAFELLTQFLKSI